MGGLNSVNHKTIIAPCITPSTQLKKSETSSSLRPVYNMWLLLILDWLTKYWAEIIEDETQLSTRSSPLRQLWTWLIWKSGSQTRVFEASGHSPAPQRAVHHSPKHWILLHIYHVQGVIFSKITHLISLRGAEQFTACQTSSYQTDWRTTKLHSQRGCVKNKDLRPKPSIWND
jgi:hypothetical protein